MKKNETKVVKVSVGMGNKFSDPRSKYENFSPYVTFEVEVAQDADLTVVIKEYQKKAEEAITSYKKELLQDLKGSVPVEKEAPYRKPAATTTMQCPKCSSPMVIRTGSKGTFFGCSTFPNCRGVANIKQAKPKVTTPVNGEPKSDRPDF